MNEKFDFLGVVKHVKISVIKLITSVYLNFCHDFLIALHSILLLALPLLTKT